MIFSTNLIEKFKWSKMHGKFEIMEAHSTDKTHIQRRPIRVGIIIHLKIIFPLPPVLGRFERLQTRT